MLCTHISFRIKKRSDGHPVPDALFDEVEDRCRILLCVDKKKSARILGCPLKIPFLNFFEKCRILEVFLTRSAGKTLHRGLGRYQKKDRQVGTDRPSCMHCGKPCFRVGNDAGKRYLLVSESAVGIPV